MTTFNNGESGISVRTKINDAIEKVDGAQPITSADINGGTIDGTVIGGTTPAAISGTTITGTSFVTTGDMTFGDNDKAIFGAGSDLQIYHSGSNSHITEGGTGNLIIRADDFRVQSNAGEEYIAADANGAVSLRYDNSTKLATTSTGIDVTGEVQGDSLDIDGAADISGQVNFHSNVVWDDNNKLIIGNGSDLQIYHDGAHSYIWDNGTGDLRIKTNGSGFRFLDSGNNYLANFVASAQAELYYNTVKKLATTSTGVDVTGTVTADGLTMASGSQAVIGVFGTSGLQLIGQTGSDNIVGTMGASEPLIFRTASTERMRITSTGNVGIGTSSPTAKLSVTGLAMSSASGGVELEGSWPWLKWKDTELNQDSWLQYIDGGNFITKQIAYADRNSAPSTVGSERMRIDSSGNALIGYTSSNGSYKLQVNSQIFATSSTIATSDGRYKENVTPLTGALDLVSALNPVHFDWKPHSVHDFDIENTTIGFIAQEVEDVLADKPYLGSIVKSNTCVITPEETDEDGNVIAEAVTEEFLGIAEGNLVALLTKAIQEQKAIIDALETRITALEG